MDNHEHMHDQELEQFDKWLRNSAVQPQAGMVERVRARLQDSSSVDGILDKLLEPDYSLRDPSMLQKVRQRLQESSSKSNRLAWTTWLPPLAAAATLMLAFISFQKQAPSPSLPDMETPTLASVETMDRELELTRIMALAASLQSSTDVAKLDSAEDLAFLFE
jgi:hypothetical protein